MGDGAIKTPDLSPAYRAAQHQLAIFSGLLIAWETIGLDVQQIPAVGIQIKDPNAVPYVLLVLVIYSGVRMFAEWMQCDSGRRNDRWAFVDFSMAWVIAAFALAAYVTRKWASDENVVVILSHTATLIFCAWFGGYIYKMVIRGIGWQIGFVVGPLLLFNVIIWSIGTGWIFFEWSPFAMALLGYFVGWLMNRLLGDPLQLFVVDRRLPTPNRPPPRTHT